MKRNHFTLAILIGFIALQLTGCVHEPATTSTTTTESTTLRTAPVSTSTTTVERTTN